MVSLGINDTSPLTVEQYAYPEIFVRKLVRETGFPGGIGIPYIFEFGCPGRDPVFPNNLSVRGPF